MFCLNSNLCWFSQADDEFWKKEYDHEAAKRARKAKKAARRAATKKRGENPYASEFLQLEDSFESEVALDSLGSFFKHLINTDYHQDDTGTSQGVEEEVTIISSDYEPLPGQKSEE